MALLTLKHCPLCREICTQQVSVYSSILDLLILLQGHLFALCVAWEDVNSTSPIIAHSKITYTQFDSDDLSTPEIAPVPISSLVCGDDGDNDDYELDSVSNEDSEKKFRLPTRGCCSIHP